MKITWYGTASILIESENASLMFDPYLKDLPKNGEPKELFDSRLNAFRAQRSVIITHGHFDHLASIKKIYEQSDCNIYLTKTPYKTLQKRNFPTDRMTIISPNEKLNFNGVLVTALKGKHVEFLFKDLVKHSFKKDAWLHPLRKNRLSIEYLKYPERGEILFYEIEAENKLIQLMGSAGLDENVNYRTGADLLILPHQGRSDIDDHNKRIVERLKPKRVLLDHYDNSFPPYTVDVPVDDFCDKMSKTVLTEKLIEGESVEV